MSAVKSAFPAPDWLAMNPAQKRNILRPFARKLGTPDDEAAEAFESDKHTLAQSPHFIAELALTTADCEAIAKALQDGDTLQVGCIVADALEREAQESIEIRADRDCITQGEAAARLAEVYS